MKTVSTEFTWKLQCLNLFAMSRYRGRFDSQLAIVTQCCIMHGSPTGHGCRHPSHQYLGSNHRLMLSSWLTPPPPLHDSGSNARPPGSPGHGPWQKHNASMWSGTVYQHSNTGCPVQVAICMNVQATEVSHSSSTAQIQGRKRLKPRIM